jgi:CheY-like chemotaxis protein
VCSKLGRGTQFSIDLPSLKRGERVIIVEAGGVTAALVASQISGYATLKEPDHAGDSRFVDLSKFFGVPQGSRGRVLVKLSGGAAPRAILVDRIVAEEEVVIRPWPKCIGAVEPFEGFTLLSSGRPAPILDVRDLGAATGTPNPAAGTGASMPEPAPIRVLLVDDSRITREMLRRLLAESGFDVVAVSSADAALIRLKQSPFDCVVTDIEMAGIDGLELTRRIRGDRVLTHLPVVVVSTRDRSSDRFAGLDAGADAYLTKQRLDTRELSSIVRRLGQVE